MVTAPASPRLRSRTLVAKQGSAGGDALHAGALGQVHDAALLHGEDHLQDLPLLKVSLPTPVGSVAGRYCLSMWRAARKQLFGVNFNAAPTSGGRPGAITVADGCSHLGLGQSDRLLTINNVQPESVAQCVKILSESTSIVLVLQQSGTVVTENDGQAWRPQGGADCWQCRERRRERGGGGLVPEASRVLLSLARPVVTDAAKGEFELELRRDSAQQRFGLPFTAEVQAELPVVFLKEDMPHLALLEGDRVVRINGEPVDSMQRCKRILNSAMSLKLVLKRSRAGLAQLTPALDAEEDEVCIQEVSPKAMGRGCGALSLF